MSALSASVLPPRRFSSPGLDKLLLRLGAASETALDTVSRNPGNVKMLTALADAGIIEGREVIERIAEDLAIEFIELTDAEMSELQTRPEILELLDHDFFLECRCLPLRRVNDSLVVAMADPLDHEAVDELEFIIQSDVIPAIAEEEKIIKAIDRFYTPDDIEHVVEYNDSVAGISTAQTDTELEIDDFGDERSVQEASQKAPIVKLVNKILSDAVYAGASDVHLEPTASSLEVRIRVDGIMRSALSVPKRLQAYVTTRIKVLSGMDITVRQRPQDGRFRMRTGGDVSTDLRVSSVPTPFGEKLVLRLLRPDSASLTLENLGLPVETEARFREALSGTERVILAAGPTGSGKTTTLYSALLHLKDNTTNIVTVEDPIEFRIPGTTQIQVDTKTGMTFASGLRSILRQDPDIILVGEIRDLETADIAAQAAQTGHLVLSTIHTNSAPGAVVRLLDLGLEPFIIASSLGAVIAQRLVRRVCPRCERELTDEEAERTSLLYGLNTEKMRIGSGCDYCGQTGLRGRLGVYSLLVVNQEVREAIRRGASEEEISTIARPSGMKDLYEAAMDLVEQGHSTVAEVERVVGAQANGNGQRALSASPVVPLENVVEGGGASNGPRRKRRDTDTGDSIADLAKSVEHESAEPDRINILLVDDDEGIRAVMSHALKRAGYSVKTAEDGSVAAEMLKQMRPDLIVCDVLMPVVDGRTFMKNLKSDESTADIPVLMMTACDDEDNEIELISAGADDFVSKASSPALVLARIERLLR